MKLKLFVMLACMAIAVPVLTSAAMSSERSDATPAPWSNRNSLKFAQANTDQCNPACTGNDICCRLSGLEAACVAPDDCFRMQQKLKKK